MTDSQFPTNIQSSIPRWICLIGPDGTGKSTFTQQIIDLAADNGADARRVWLRFPFFVSIPILVYCRLTGLSYYFECQGVRYGVWEMWRSRWVPRVFPWCQLADTFLFMIAKIYIPLLLGRTIFCDRFVHDVLIDVMIGVGDHELYKKRVGRYFFRLVPDWVKVVGIDAPAELVFVRRPELRYDHSWETRRALYLELYEALRIPVVDNSRTINLSQKELRTILRMINL